jgi:hypothetical protein
MLTIRDAQLAALGRAHDERTDERICAHLWAIWPSRCERMGAGGLRHFTAACREKARGHGAVQWGDLARFAGVALFLGVDFDLDPGFPWAREILDAPAPTPTVKVDRLVRALDAWIDAQAGGNAV